MRHLITPLILTFCLNLQAQTVDKIKFQIDSLTKRKSDIEKELALINQEIQSKNKFLTEVKVQEFEKSLTIKSMKDINALDSKSIATGNKIFVIKKNEDFTLLNFDTDFYLVNYKDQKGYVYYVYLNGISGIEDYKSYWTKKNEENRQLEKQRELAEKKSGRLQKLTQKFGSENAFKIINKKIWIGMTDEMTRESIGNPEKVNRSTYSSGTHEQWIYKDKYVYFENGILTSWQDED